MAPLDWEEGEGEEEWQSHSNGDCEQDDVDFEDEAEHQASASSAVDNDGEREPGEGEEGMDDALGSTILQFELSRDDSEAATVPVQHSIFYSQGIIQTSRFEELLRLLHVARAQTNRVHRESPTRVMHTVDEHIYPPVKDPNPTGLDLLNGGDFGAVRQKRRRVVGNRVSRNLARKLLNRQRSLHRMSKEEVGSDILPNSNGVVVARYKAAAYSGQYSPDSSLYYTCCRDFHLHIYDATVPIRREVYKHEDHNSTMKLFKTVHAPADSWTITDSHLSPDNERMIWASVATNSLGGGEQTSTVYMTSTKIANSTQIPISFQDPHQSQQGSFGWRYGSESCGIWSCRFSADGHEIVAGGDGKIFVYDLSANKRTVKIDAHEDDVNSCCWADSASGNILISASDDTFLKVWDRRSLGANPEPSGVLIGHTEGITYVSPKGDGRYVISNGKDQKLRLWDLRKMRSNLEYEAERSHFYGIPQFDYRQNYYVRSSYQAHPKDCSVMEYHGHRVLRTLIRCHFSPSETTGQQYIYSGSSDGRIHIWSLDGTVVQVLDRRATSPIAFDPSDAEPLELKRRVGSVCVRDVSWHAHEPVLMSTGWEGYQGRLDGSSIARHEWKGLLKGKGGLLQRGELEDYVASRNAEQRERRYRMPGRLSGYEYEEDTDYFPDDDS